MRRSLALLLGAMVLLTAYGGAPPAAATSQKLAPFGVGYPAPSAAFMPLFVGIAQGFFEQYGLDAKADLLRGSSSETQALVSGSVKMIIAEANPALTAMGRGVRDVLVGNAIRGFSMQLWVKPSITSPKQLEGKTLGLLHVASLSDSAAHEVLPKLGVDLSKVNLDYLGAPPNATAALIAGKVDAMVNDAPSTFLAEQKGFKMLVDFKTYPHVSNGFWVMRSFLKQHPDEVEAFLKGYIRAVAFLDDPSNRARIESILSKNVGIKDRTVLAKTYHHITTENFFQPVPEVRPGDIADSIRFAEQKDHVKLIFNQIYARAPLDALWKSGFVEKYASKLRK